MRGFAVAFSAFLTFGAFGADFVKFGPELCDDWEYRINGECVTKQQGRCAAGYYVANFDDATYSGLINHEYCTNSYDEFILPDFFSLIYNATLVKFGPELCGAGYDTIDGKCERRVQGACPSGFYKTAVNQVTLSGHSVGGQLCTNSYDEYEISDDFYILYNGVLVEFGAVLCGDGMRMSDGDCVPVSQNTCPENYYDIIVSDETLQKNNAGKCGNGYLPYNMTVNCTSNTSEPLCAVLCDNNLAYTGVGTCAVPCDHQIKTSTGITIPLYSQSQIIPSLNVQIDDGVCFGNMIQGAQQGAININYNGSIYHITD